MIIEQVPGLDEALDDVAPRTHARERLSASPRRRSHEHRDRRRRRARRRLVSGALALTWVVAVACAFAILRTGSTPALATRVPRPIVNPPLVEESIDLVVSDPKAARIPPADPESILGAPTRRQLRNLDYLLLLTFKRAPAAAGDSGPAVLFEALKGAEVKTIPATRP